MGWGVSDYPGAPEHALRCAAGCSHVDELYECQAKACGKQVCEGCVYQCADCQSDFCEEHIVDLNDVAGARYSIFVCAPCFAQRQAQQQAA